VLALERLQRHKQDKDLLQLQNLDEAAGAGSAAEG
jgi:hypothetical protein